jgi:LacI family transcriptional regulator
MRHLIDQGCRNIAIIAGWVDVPHLHNRLLGCEKALREADLLSRGQFLINSRYGFYEEGRRAAKRILNRKSEIDGVFSAAGDRVAIGAINYFKERGRKVPENIRVVGFDDVPESAYFDPPLTTVHQPIFKLGFKAADYLVRTLEGKRPGVENTVLEPKLIIRKSG